MWAAGDINKVRLLLAKGANVNARSNFARTPLIIAALHNSSHEIARLLIDKGADVTACDKKNFCVLEAAAQGNDTATVRMVLARGANVKAKDETGTDSLMWAAINGNVEVAKLLLKNGSDVNAVAIESFFTVKNGPLEIGRFTPLLCAIPYGPPELVKLLIYSGANIDARDARGMTSLMLAVSTDRPNVEIIRLLLAKGADPSIRSKRGETTFDWANKFHDPEVLDALKMTSAAIPVAKSTVAITNRNNTEIKASVEKSLALLQNTNGRFINTGGCVACHGQNLTGMAASVARAHGARVDDKLDAEMARNTAVLQGGLEQLFLQLVDPPPGVEGMEYSLLHMGESHIPASRAVDAAVLYIAARQREDGNWPYLAGGVPRPPIQDGDFFSTAIGIRCLQLYKIPGRGMEFQEQVRRAGMWLNNAQPLSTEDRVMQLLGLQWAGMPAESRTKELLALQRDDGGWAQTPWLQSDAYATGQVLYALHEEGIPATDPAYVRGVAYLQNTQRPDGSWHVSSRAPKFQPYFQSGFPYDDDQWISSAATAWAAMGMAYAIPATIVDAQR
jgi:ankyrin repeat protein